MVAPSQVLENFIIFPRLGAGRASHAAASALLALKQSKEAPGNVFCFLEGRDGCLGWVVSAQFIWGFPKIGGKPPKMDGL